MCESELAELVDQLLTAQPARAATVTPGFNPRPAGSVCAGSATEAVLKYLRDERAFRTEAQIMWATGRSHSAVSWALLYARKRGWVRAVGDAVRNSRYLRYVAVQGQPE